MKKLLALVFGIAFGLTARLDATLILHSLSQTAMPAENVNSQQMIWLYGTNGRIYQASSDTNGNLRVTLNGQTISAAISGTITANQGTPGASPWPVADTLTAATLSYTAAVLTTTAAVQALIYASLTTGAAVAPTGFDLLTSVALVNITTNATTVVNITQTAAYSGNCALLYTITLVSGANYLVTANGDGGTAPASFSSSVGDSIFPSIIKVADIEMAPATPWNVFIRANTLSATSATAYLTIYKRKC